MKTKDIKLNFILNMSRLFLGTFFIILTMPYVTRILGSENLGSVEYVNSIVAYFLLFTALGIPSYGIREVARTRNNKKELSRTVFELLLILLMTTVVGYIIFFILINNLTELKAEKLLFIIMGTNILFTNIGVEWFYQGMENQIYITIRFIVTRVLALVLLFLFVKKETDFYIYGAILVLMSSGSNIFNIINLRNHIEFKNLGELSLKRHLKPILTIFSASLAASIYMQLSSIMLGSMVGVEYVAFYTVANKLVRLVLVLVTALGVVMIPRLSNCLKEEDILRYRNYANVSLKYILIIAVPSMVGVFLLSKEVIYIMAGEKFYPSIITMQITSLIILFVGLAYFIGFQVLYPYNLEKYYTYSVITAAIANFIFNYFFIPKYAQNGAAIGTAIAELIGVLMMLYFAKDKLKELEFYNKKNLVYFVSAFIMGVVIFFIKKLNLKDIEKLFTSVILGGITYFTILFLFKEYFVMEGLKLIKSKFKRS